MTSEEFESAYAHGSGIDLAELRKHRTVRPCNCGDESCDGWQSLSHEMAAEYDGALERRRLIALPETQLDEVYGPGLGQLKRDNKILNQHHE